MKLDLKGLKVADGFHLHENAWTTKVKRQLFVCYNTLLLQITL